MSDIATSENVEQWLPTREIRLDFMFDPRENPMHEQERWDLVTTQLRWFFNNLCADIAALMDANSTTISEEDMAHLLWCQQQVTALMDICVYGKPTTWDRIREGIAVLAARISRREE